MSYSKRGTLVRVAYLGIACGLWVLSGGGRIKRGQIVVLCFHGVTHDQRKRFDKMVRFVSDRAIATQCLDDKLQQRSPRVCFTFDDAFANLLVNAIPVLKRNGVSATIYAVSDNLGVPPSWSMPEGHCEANEVTMTSAQLQSAMKAGMHIGSHTQSHAALSQLSMEEVRSELVRSRAALESMLGVKVDELAFPFGDFDDRVVSVAKDAGYRYLYSLEPVLYPKCASEGVVGRFAVDPEMWFIEFVLTCDGAYSWLHQLRCLVQMCRQSSFRQIVRLSTTESVG